MGTLCRTLAVLAVLALLVPLAPVWARDGPGDIEGAGPVLIVPFDRDEDTSLAMGVTLKLLPVEEPDALTLKSSPAYLAANTGVELLVRNRVDLGLSAALYTVEGNYPVRLGLAYTSDEGASYLVKGDLIVSRTTIDAQDATFDLAPRERPAESLSYFLGPGTFGLLYQREL